MPNVVESVAACLSPSPTAPAPEFEPCPDSPGVKCKPNNTRRG